MPRRFVDLSIYLENDVISDPVPFGPKIQYHKHADTAGQIAGFFPGLKKEDLPDGAGWDGAWPYANLGVLAAFAIGLVVTLVARRSAVRRQEAGAA